MASQLLGQDVRSHDKVDHFQITVAHQTVLNSIRQQQSTPGRCADIASKLCCGLTRKLDPFKACPVSQAGLAVKEAI